MWKNSVKPDKPQTTKWLTRVVCWVLKAKHTNSDNVILIAFPLQKIVARTPLNGTSYAKRLSCLLGLHLKATLD